MANVVVAGKISMSAAASTPVYVAMTAADAARWRCRGGLHLVVQGRAESWPGDRREVGADLGQTDSAPGQRVNRPVVALCRNADHRNQVTTAYRDGGYRRRGRFLIQRRTAVTFPILPDYVPVPRASPGREILHLNPGCEPRAVRRLAA
jgi:hypothetical protein